MNAQLEYQRLIEEAGRRVLAEQGYAIGDIVYLDAQVEATIENAYLEGSMLTIMVSVVGELLAAYWNKPEYANCSKVIIPCYLGNISKIQYAGDDLKRWMFLKRYNLQNSIPLNEVPDEAIK